MFKKLIPTLLAVTLAFSLPAAALAGNKLEANDVDRIVIIIIDGLLQKHLHSSQAPNITNLYQSGTSVQKVINVPENLSGAVSLILTGERNPGENALAGFYAAMQKNGVKTAVIDGTGGKLASLSRGASVVKDGPFQSGGKGIIETALEEINSSGDIFCLIVLPGPTADNQSQSALPLSLLDNQVGLLLYHLRDNDMTGDTCLAITGSTVDPPAALQGKKIRDSINVPAASLADVFATLKYVSDQRPPETGMVFYEAIDLVPAGSSSRNNLLEQRIKELSQAYAQASAALEAMEKEQTEVKQQQSQLDAEKAQYTKVIEKQQSAINSLELKIKIFKIVGYFLFVVFIIILYAEYRFLKKRFLFFT